MVHKVEVVNDKGEYKEFSYRKKLYLDGKLIWLDDYHNNVSDEVVVLDFCRVLLEETGVDYEKLYD